MNQHTPEPWINHGNGDIMAKADMPDGLTDIAMVYPRIDGADEANARRIVACVNACAGIGTDTLERKSILKLQRDELSNALKVLRNARTTYELTWAHKLADAAIAKAEQS